MSAPLVLGPLKECFAVEHEAEELAAMKRRQSVLCTKIRDAMMLTLLGIAVLFGTVCGISQLLIFFRSIG